jgi:hypothetical protein
MMARDATTAAPHASTEVRNRKAVLAMVFVADQLFAKSNRTAEMLRPFQSKTPPIGFVMFLTLGDTVDRR